MNFPFRLAGAATALLVLGACAGKPRMADMSLDEIANSFRACVGPMGLRAELPQLAPDGGSGLKGEFIKLSDPGVMSDGYHHWLTVDREKSIAFIHESGGFAGRPRVYGPLILPVDCPPR